MIYVNVFDNDSCEMFNEYLCEDKFLLVILMKKLFIYL